MKIVKEDITNIGNAVEKALAYEISDTNNLINAISGFINGSKEKLVGDVWEKEMSLFENYIKVLNKRKNIANSLLNGARNANNIMMAYVEGFMGDASQLDTALIPELEAKLKQIYQLIEQLLEQSRETGVAVDVSELYAEAKRIEAIVEYLKKMPPTDNQAYQCLSEAKSDISTIQNEINRIKVSNIS